MSARELLDGLRDSVGLLDDEALRQIMDIAECEIINRMAQEAGYAYMENEE
jgi:hypothetical protein